MASLITLQGGICAGTRLPRHFGRPTPVIPSVVEGSLFGGAPRKRFLDKWSLEMTGEGLEMTGGEGATQT